MEAMVNLQQQVAAAMGTADSQRADSLLKDAPICIQLFSGKSVAQQASNWATLDDVHKDLQQVTSLDRARGAGAKAIWEETRIWQAEPHFGRTPSVTTSSMKAGGHSEEHQVGAPSCTELRLKWQTARKF
jgi:hypothetical protein